MRKKQLYIFILLFSYAIALGHDLIPHHHFNSPLEFEHHHHHHNGDHHNHDTLVDISEHPTSDLEYHFCHYSTCDNTALTSIHSEIKLVKDFPSFIILHTNDLFSASLHKPISKLENFDGNFRPHSSPHLLSSGLRAPPSMN